MTDPWFVRLWIWFDGTAERLNELIEEARHATPGGNLLVAFAGRNKDLRKGTLLAARYDLIDSSNYTGEIYNDDWRAETSFEAHKLAVSNLVTRLRTLGMFVAVACEFEEEIIERTGWNWSEADPTPPGWERRSNLALRTAT